ncbi:MAG: hypothetical protein U0U69_13550 [Acidimicrobiia bacterium]
MLEALVGLPEGVIGFEAVGEVHSGDYSDVLVPAIEAAAAGGESAAVPAQEAGVA